MVYAALIAVAIFIALVSTFSGTSFKTMRDGSVIVDVASSRILDSVIVWQYTSAFYARTIKLRPVSLISFFQGLINASATNLFAENDRLRSLIQDFGNQEVIKMFYGRNLDLYVPYKNTTFSSSRIDGFTASEFLAQKSLFIVNYQDSPLLLTGNENILFILNNTGNDYLVSLQQQVSLSESLVQKELNKNQAIVTILLALEFAALGCVQISLLFVARVVLKSYSKLFRVILKIRPDEQIQRLKELETVQGFFAKDIEAKEFSIKGEALVEPRNVKSIHVKKKK